MVFKMVITECYSMNQVESSPSKVFIKISEAAREYPWDTKALAVTYIYKMLTLGFYYIDSLASLHDEIGIQLQFSAWHITERLGKI